MAHSRTMGTNPIREMVDPAFDNFVNRETKGETFLKTSIFN